jgi:hypothetical protein
MTSTTRRQPCMNNQSFSSTPHHNPAVKADHFINRAHDMDACVCKQHLDDRHVHTHPNRVSYRANWCGRTSASLTHIANSPDTRSSQHSPMHATAHNQLRPAQMTQSHVHMPLAIPTHAEHGDATARLVAHILIRPSIKNKNPT